MITTKTCAAETVTIHIAGDYDKARDICRKWTSQVGRCVTVSPASYVYSFGEEAGVIVGLRSYPRFPPAEGEIETLALELAKLLMDELCQRTAMVYGKEHIWLARE